MAAPIKRQKDTKTFDENGEKRIKLDEKLDKVDLFVSWAKTNNYLLTDKVKIGREDSCAQYGMVAVADIAAGETLFQIPRNLLISPETCAIKGFLSKEKLSIKGTSGWAPLLIALMYEYNNPSSVWRPYLDLVPDFDELDLPMFWPREERLTLLKGSGVIEAVDKDLTNIEKEFNTTVLPFIKKYEDQFSPVCKDLEFYKKMVAFVMAYSFTEQAQQEEEEDEHDGKIAPVMVPMADILNHVAKNNACLKFEKEAFKMVTTKPIKKGEEVYNTYGELANLHLLHMYGFAEAYPENHWDTVELPSINVLAAASDLSINTDDLIQKKKDYLQGLGLYGEDISFIVGTDGILDEEEMCQVLKVCCMSEEALKERTEVEDWESEEEEEDNDISLTFDLLTNVKKDWKEVLKKSATLSLQRYSTTIAEDDIQLQQSDLTTRQKYSLYTVYGQKQILQMLIDKC